MDPVVTGGGGVGDGTAKPKTITVKTKDGKTVVITLKKPLSKEQLSKLQKLGIIIDATGNAIATTTNSVLSIQKLVNEASGTSYEIINLEKLGLEIGNIGKITLKNAGDLLTIFSMGLSMDNMVQNGLNWTDGTNFVMTATAFIPEVGWAIAGGYWIANLIIENRTGFQIGHFVEIGANYEQKQWDKFPETSPLSHPFFP